MIVSLLGTQSGESTNSQRIYELSLQPTVILLPVLTGNIILIALKLQSLT